MAAEVAKTGSGSVWVPVVVGSVISGVVSGTVGYVLGSRKTASCSCKTKGATLPESGNDGNSGNNGNGKA